MTHRFRASFRGTVPRPIRWFATFPLRLYLRHSPFRRGKGFIERFLIATCIPADSPLDIVLPNGDRVQMSAREKIGSYLLIYETFEMAELEFCGTLLARGATAIDVGANVGLFTLTLARLVGDTGMVIAIEASPENFARLTQHISANAVVNVRSLALAAGRQNGIGSINLDVDPAFGSAVTGAAPAGPTPGCNAAVTVRRLDDIWRDLGSPAVALIKIDVEGGEYDVLLGAQTLLSVCKPTVIVEAPTAEQLARLSEVLAGHSYRCRQPPGFQPWNYVFSADGPS